MCLRRLIYNEKHPAAFICYKHTDDDSLPNLIREHLKNKGYFAFLNHQDIMPAENYDDYLARSIKNAANFILVVTESTFLKISELDDYVCKEIRITLRNNKKIIPVINLDKSGSFPNDSDLPSVIQKLVARETGNWYPISLPAGHLQLFSEQSLKQLISNRLISYHKQSYFCLSRFVNFIFCF